MRILLILLPWLCLLTSCDTPRIEFISPELRKEGLTGKTIALCPVVCADWNHDPTIGEAALLEQVAHQQLTRLRPKTIVVDTVHLERITGPVKTRHAGKSQPLSSRVMTTGQWAKLQSKGVHLALIPEIVENRCSQQSFSETRKETVEERDEHGNVTRTCEREYNVIVSRATRCMTLRFHLIETARRSTVWQARMTSGAGDANEQTQNFFDTVAPPMPSVPPMDDLAERMITKTLRRLPK